MGILAIVLVFGMTIVGCDDGKEKDFKVSIIIKNISPDKTIDGYLFSTCEYGTWNEIKTEGTITLLPGETSAALGPFTAIESARGGRDFDFYISVINGYKNIGGTHDAKYTFSEEYGIEPPSSITLVYNGGNWLALEK